jgi:hypothetical protein
MGLKGKMMPDKSAVAVIAKGSAVTSGSAAIGASIVKNAAPPTNTSALVDFFGMPLSDLACLVAIVAGIVSIGAYGVKIWRDIQMGKSAKRNRLIIKVGDED